jgi:hypothetical protein
MDLNYLYHRQQISLMRADRAACDPSRAAHEGLASLYSSMIERWRSDRRPLHAAIGGAEISGRTGV